MTTKQEVITKEHVTALERERERLVQTIVEQAEELRALKSREGGLLDYSSWTAREIISFHQRAAMEVEGKDSCLQALCLTGRYERAIIDLCAERDRLATQAIGAKKL